MREHCGLPLTVPAGQTSAQLVVPGRNGPCLTLPSAITAFNLILILGKMRNVVRSHRVIEQVDSRIKGHFLSPTIEIHNTRHPIDIDRSDLVT